MKTYLYIAILLLPMRLLFAQQKTEAYFGHPGKWDQVNDIIELYDKGYYIIAGYEGDPYHFGWNIKTDINLEFIYDKEAEHDLSLVAQFAAVSDENGNIYITGFTTIFDQWPFVTKIDSCGNKVWCKILQYDDEFEYGYSVDILFTNDNEIIILSSFDSEEEIEKLHLVGLNQEGDVLWKKPYATKYDHPWIREPNAYSIKEINNDYYISGYCYWPYPDDTTHFYLRPFFIGIDSLFEEKWILPFAPLDSVFGDAYKTIALNDSVLMGIGERWLEGIDKNTILMFYDTSGQTLGYSQVPTDSIGPNLIANVSRGIERINDSLFITFSVWGSTPDGGICSEMVIDTSGRIYYLNESAYCIGSGSLIKTYDNNYVYAVTVEETKGDWDIYVYKIDENLNDVPFDPTPHNYDSLCPGIIQSGTIDLTSCFVWTDIGEAPNPKEYYSFIATIPITAYPNPAETEITLAIENTEHHTNMLLECYNIYGQKVHSEKIWKGQQQTRLDVSEWSNGLYFAVVKSNGKVAGMGRFVRE